MQAIMEPIFHVVYLTTVITLGFKMVSKSKDNYFKSFGMMSIILGLGDSFHLIPRIYALLNTKTLDMIMYLLSALRITLCLFPQNEWFVNNPPVSWGIYRNIPFTIMGIIMIYLLYSYGSKYNNKDYKNLGIAVFLSFAFYAPVVLWASESFLVGMLMIPKTLAYVWVVLIGYKEFKKSIK